MSRLHSEKPLLPTQCSKLKHHAGRSRFFAYRSPLIFEGCSGNGAPTKAYVENTSSGRRGVGHSTESASKMSSCGAVKLFQKAAVKRYWLYQPRSDASLAVRLSLRNRNDFAASAGASALKARTASWLAGP
eukprot:2433096-Prymnesium_polylepis.2